MSRGLVLFQKFKSVLPILTILIASLCGMLYFGHKKQGYHVDELYSYGLANSEYLPFMHFGISGYDVKDWMKEYGAGENFGDLFSNLVKDFQILKASDFDFYNSEIYTAYRIAQANSADTYTTTWVQGQDYIDYLTVSEDNTFNYASVYYNQRGDVHPPLFYILLHTICSIFQGVFSKWFGLALNIILLLITLIVLYQMGMKYFGGKGIALAIVIAYACSSGFMSTAMFIRMYTLLTLMTLLCCYVHLKIQEADYHLSKKLAVALFFSVLGGYYTQYYFVLYALGIAVVMFLSMLVHKKYKSAFQYGTVLACAAIAGIIIWPFSVKHVFTGYRGRASLSILTSGSFYAYKAKYMFQHIIQQIFGGNLFLPILAFLTAIVVCLLLGKFLWKKKLPFAKIFLVAVPIFIYTFVVGQISPFLTDRYVMCTYPFWCIMFVCALYYSILYLASGCSKSAALILIAGTLVFSNNYFRNTPGYLNTSGQETYKVPAGTDCVFVIPDGSYNESAEETSILAQCERVGVVYESDIAVLAEGYTYESGDYLLVEMIQHLDIENVLSKVQEALKVTNLRELERTYGSNCVRILLGE